jgi:hypothetical protein
VNVQKILDATTAVTRRCSPDAYIPAVRQNRSKLTEMASQALPTAPIPVGGEAIDVVGPR